LSTEEAVKRKWIGMLKITCGREVTEVRTEGGPGGEGREPEINLSRVPTFSRRENIQEEINVDTTLDSPRKGFAHSSRNGLSRLSLFSGFLGFHQKEKFSCTTKNIQLHNLGFVNFFWLKQEFHLPSRE
jgi:hypothetical protein